MGEFIEHLEKGQPVCCPFFGTQAGVVFFHRDAGPIFGWSARDRNSKTA
jgi:hypothetical protein